MRDHDDSLPALAAELRAEVARLTDEGMKPGDAWALLLGDSPPPALTEAMGMCGGVLPVPAVAWGRPITVYVAAHGQGWEASAVAWQAILSAIPEHPERGCTRRLRAGLGRHVAGVVDGKTLTLSCEAARADRLAALRQGRRAGVIAVPVALWAGIRACLPRPAHLAHAGGVVVTTTALTLGAMSLETHHPGPGAVPPGRTVPAVSGLTVPRTPRHPVTRGAGHGGKAAAGLSRRVPATGRTPGQPARAGAPGGSVTTAPLPPGASPTPSPSLTTLPSQPAPTPTVSVPPLPLPAQPGRAPHPVLPHPKAPRPVRSVVHHVGQGVGRTVHHLLGGAGKVTGQLGHLLPSPGL